MGAELAREGVRSVNRESIGKSIREQARSHRFQRRPRGSDQRSALIITMQLGHQLGFGLGQAAGLGEFVDARAHADQSRGLGE